MNIIELERPEGVIATLGGQTAINLARPLADRGVTIVGTDCEAIDRAENRDSFEKVLLDLKIPQRLQVSKMGSGRQPRSVIRFWCGPALCWEGAPCRSLPKKKHCVDI